MHGRALRIATCVSQEISLLEQLADLLPDKVGSLLSIKSLREDLDVDHKTAERWVTILEHLYVCFRHLGERHYQTGKTTVIPFATWCRALHMP
jgi:predicted AAA+ superfamily ATPase